MLLMLYAIHLVDLKYVTFLTKPSDANKSNILALYQEAIVPVKIRFVSYNERGNKFARN